MYCVVRYLQLFTNLLSSANTTHQCYFLLEPLKVLTLSHLVLYLLQAETCLHGGVACAHTAAKGSGAPQPPCPDVSLRPTASSYCNKDFKVPLCLRLLVFLTCFSERIEIPVVSLVRVAQYDESFHSTSKKIVIQAYNYDSIERLQTQLSASFLCKLLQAIVCWEQWRAMFDLI